jgi:hypothetical protein
MLQKAVSADGSLIFASSCLYRHLIVFTLCSFHMVASHAALWVQKQAEQAEPFITGDFSLCRPCFKMKCKVD